MVHRHKNFKLLRTPEHRNKFIFKRYSGIMIILIAISGIILSMGMRKLPRSDRLAYSELNLEGVQVRRFNEKYVDETSTSTDLEVVIYLTNNGELNSGAISIDAYIRSFDSLGRETPCNSNATANLGQVETNSTGKTRLNFQRLVFNQNEKYTIDLYIWEDQKVAEKASTTLKVPYIEFEPEPDAPHTQAAVECIVTHRHDRDFTKIIPRSASILRPYY